MVELVPPPVVLWVILQCVWINEEFLDFLRKVVNSLRVLVGITFRAFWYPRNIGNIIEWHWFPLLNSS